MNGDDDQMRYAEYVLGVLDADERAAVAREIATLSEAAVAAALWERRLTPLADSIEEVAPAPRVWTRIEQALQPRAPEGAPSRGGLWDNLALWHWLGLGASVLAVALLVVLSNPRPTPLPVPPAAPANYMASTLQQDNGTTGWTITMDPQRARLVVVPATPLALETGRAPELWLVPAGGKPIAVGVISRDRPATFTLDPTLVALLGPTAVLAVSVEPLGGSPTGQPTGAIIAKGAIGAAPAAGRGA